MVGRLGLEPRPNGLKDRSLCSRYTNAPWCTPWDSNPDYPGFEAGASYQLG